MNKLSYFTVNDKAEASAGKALAVCKNDNEKLAYLNKILTTCMFSHNF